VGEKGRLSDKGLVWVVVESVGYLCAFPAATGRSA
jgi:hypothetical protein